MPCWEGKGTTILSHTSTNTPLVVAVLLSSLVFSEVLKEGANIKQQHAIPVDASADMPVHWRGGVNADLFKSRRRHAIVPGATCKAYDAVRWHPAEAPRQGSYVAVDVENKISRLKKTLRHG